MKKKEVERDYRFSDAFLIQKCDEVANSVDRDQTQFDDRGFDAAATAAFRAQRDAFDALPTDEELEEEVGDATETKDASGEAVRVSSRMFRTAAGNKWGTGKAKYRKYGFDGMDEMNDAQLVRLGKRVGRVATLQLSDLAPGITAAKITAHVALVTQFDSDLDKKEDAVKDRDIATEERIIAGNELYATLVKVCNFGKDIWAAVSEAKYNDYVIYDTPSGGPETPPVTPP